MYTLYGYKNSGSAAIEMALGMAKIDFNIVDVASWAQDSPLDQLRKVNPLMQIPTLALAEGSVLTESAAILIHLGFTHPESGLLPADAHARDQTIRGLVYIASNCYPAIGIIDYPERWLADASDAAKDNLRGGTRARLHSNWEIFADTFSNAPYMGGERPNALDLLAVVVSKWSGTREYLRDSRPAFVEILERVESHASIAPVLGRHWGKG